MENTLKKLLTNDKYLIEEGTKELKQYLASPDCVVVLCNVLGTCEDFELRQYAAVILRRRFSKPANWHQINNEDKSSIKNGLLQKLIVEPEKSVKNSIAHLIGILLRYELDCAGWPELVQFLEQSMTSQSMDDKELGFYSLSILLETSPTEFITYAPQFVALFSNTLDSLEDKSSPVAFFIVLCMIHFGPAVRADRQLINKYVEMIPKVLETIQSLTAKRPDRALEALDFFYEYSEKDGISVLLARIKQVTALCLSITDDPSKNEDLRIKSLSVIATFARIKIRMLVKNGLINSILQVIFRLMCNKPEDDENEEYFTSDPDEDTLLTCACEVLDTIAMNMDSKKLIKPIMEMVKPAIEGANPYEMKAGYLALGIISQGCETYIRYNCLDQLVNCVYGGVSHNHSVVRGAALFAIGQFAEHLQPEISVSSHQLMPVLIGQIAELIERGKSGERLGNRVDRLFYAVERFAENLESALIHYVPSLIAHLLPLCKEPYHRHIRELAMSNIGAIAGAVKEGIVPYFQEIMNCLNEYLLNKAKGDDISLQVEALDTLAMLARNVGENNFEALALDSIKLGLGLVTSTDDPDIRKSAFGLFAAVSTVMKGSIGPMLPGIVQPIIRSIQDDGFLIHRDKEDANFPTFESNSGDEEDIEDSDDDISVENDFIEEKEEACFALSELATHTGEAFFPYLQTSFDEVFKLLTFPSSDVRRAALEAEFQFCISFAKITENTENRDDMNLIQVTEMLVNKATEMIKMDDDRDVLLAALDGFQNLLKEVGARLIMNNSIKESIVNSIKEVLLSKTEVQGWGEEDYEGSTDDDCEILDTAAYVIPAVMHVTSHQEFSAVFAQFLPLLSQRITDNNEEDEEEEESSKANLLGVIAECMPGLSVGVSDYLASLLPFLFRNVEDNDPDVRNNAIYALGEMAYHGKEVIVPYYGQILGALSNILAQEKKAKVMDNACGVIARLILVNPNSLPLHQVLPALISQIPLKEDFDEDKWVFRSMSHLFQLGEESLKPHVGTLFNAALVSLHGHQPDDETKEAIISLLTMINRSFPDVVSTMAGMLPPEILEVLKSISL